MTSTHDGQETPAVSDVRPASASMEVDEAATRNRAYSRRSVIAAVGAVFSVVVSTAWWRRTGGDDAPDSGPEAAPSNEATDGAGPPLQPPVAKVVKNDPNLADDVVAITSVGTPMALAVEVTAPTWTRIVHGQVVVAKPGSINGAFSPASAPDNAAMRTENHLAASQGLNDISGAVLRLEVTFLAKAAGTYPVFFLMEMVEAASRQQNAPQADASVRMLNGSQELGHIIVR